MCIYGVLYIVVYGVLYIVVSILLSILVIIMLANIDNSAWFFIFMHLSTNGNWVCKLPFFVHGDDARTLLSLAICICLRLCSLACVLVFKSKTVSLFSSVTVSSNSLRCHTFKWLHLELFVQKLSRVLRVQTVLISFYSERNKNNLKSGNACCHSVENLFPSNLLSKNIKTKISRTVIFPFVL
jgi:hypothetical protein